MNVDNTDSVATLEKLRRLPADRRRVLFTGGTVVSMDPGLGIIDNGDVLVEGDTITAVGRARPADAPPGKDPPPQRQTPPRGDTHPPPRAG
ncbi:amidohydrolase, partial [Streptomyces niveus]